MARFLVGRIRVAGTLKTLDPLHVGSGEGNHFTDMMVATDGQGRVYAAGSSLAGAFRAWCQDRFDEGLVQHVWGYQTGDQGHAAHLFVENAVIRDAGGTVLSDRGEFEVRDHVGIDRLYGAAASGIKFDRAVLPPGCTLDLEVTLDLPADNDQMSIESQAMLGHLLHALQQGAIRLGAAKSRGLGRVQLLNAEPNTVTIQDQPWTKQGILDRLCKTPGTQTIGGLKQQYSTLKPNTVDWLRIQIDWTPVLPTMVKSGVDGLIVDSLPLLGGIDGGQAPVIPGSSLKGALRTRAELILRTLLNRDPNWRTESNPRRRFLNQLDEDLPLIHELFGARGKKNGSDSVGQGALFIADCFAQQINPGEDWEKLMFAAPDTGSPTERQKMDAVATGKNAVGRNHWQVAFHNAIDRWTGGTVDNKLFQVLETHGEKWKPFALDLNLGRITEYRQAGWVLLLLVLRDLMKQRIPVGFGGNRGLGEIMVDKLTITPLEGDPCGLREKVELTTWDVTAFPDDAREQWEELWMEFIEEAKNAETAEPETLAHD